MVPFPQSDKELISRLINGEVSAFEEVFNKYNKKIYSFSLKYLKNKEDAEGIVQEVFLSLWRNCSRLHKDSNINAYLFTLCFNAIRKRFRKISSDKVKHKKYAELTSDIREMDEISEIEYSELLVKTNKYIDKLPPQQKKIILLHRDSQLSVPEIAEQLNLSRKTVENHLYKARRVLKNLMAREGLLLLFFYWWFF